MVDSELFSRRLSKEEVVYLEAELDSQTLLTQIRAPLSQNRVPFSCILLQNKLLFTRTSRFHLTLFRLTKVDTAFFQSSSISSYHYPGHLFCRPTNY